MPSKILSVSGTKKKSADKAAKPSKPAKSAKGQVPSRADDPVTEIGQIPFALCEIVAKAEAAGQPDIAKLADSIVNVLLGCGSLKLLETPPEGRAEIAAVLDRYMTPSLAGAEDTPSITAIKDCPAFPVVNGMDAQVATSGARKEESDADKERA